MPEHLFWSDEKAIDEFLKHAAIGHLTTIDPDGSPHTVPLSFVWHEGSILLHTGSGAKIGHIAKNPQAAFAVTEYLGLVTSEVTGDNNPCRDTNLGLSVLIRGQAREITEPARKLEVMNQIIAKYDPRAARLGEAHGSPFRIIEIKMSSLTARRFLLLNKQLEFRAAVAERLQKRGLVQSSAQDLKAAILLRQSLDQPDR